MVKDLSDEGSVLSREILATFAFSLSQSYQECLGKHLIGCRVLETLSQAYCMHTSSTLLAGPRSLWSHGNRFRTQHSADSQERAAGCQDGRCRKSTETTSGRNSKAFEVWVMHLLPLSLSLPPSFPSSPVSLPLSSLPFLLLFFGGGNSISSCSPGDSANS